MEAHVASRVRLVLVYPYGSTSEVCGVVDAVACVVDVHASCECDSIISSLSKDDAPIVVFL